MAFPNVLESSSSPSFAQYNRWRLEQGLPAAPPATLCEYTDPVWSGPEWERYQFQTYHIRNPGSENPEGMVIANLLTPTRYIARYMGAEYSRAGHASIRRFPNGIHGIGRSAMCVTFDAIWAAGGQPMEHTATAGGVKILRELVQANLLKFVTGFDGMCMGDTVERGVALGVPPSTISHA